MAILRETESGSGVLGGCTYLGKMVFYGLSNKNLDFIPLWLSPDVGEIPLGC